MASKSHFFRGLKEEYLINFNSTNNDYIRTDNLPIINGVFNWEIKFSFSEESLFNYVALFGVSNKNRVIVSESQNKIIVNIGGSSNLIGSFNFSFNTLYVLKIRRDLTNNIYYSVNESSEVLLGNNSNVFGTDAPYNYMTIGAEGNFNNYRLFTGQIYYLKMFYYGNWLMNDGSGLDVRGSDGNNGTIITDQDINYVNNVMWKSAAPIEYNLVAQYDFNNNLIDSIGGNNGTGTDITFNSGSFGNESVFNGLSSFIEVSDNDIFSFTDGVNDLPFKIDITFRLESNVQQYIINKRGAPGTFEWQLIQNFNTFQIALGNSSASSVLISDVAFNYVQGNYYNVVVVYDGSKKQNGLRISVDNVRDVPDPNNPSYLGMNNTSSNMVIGRSGQTNNRYLNGAISQIKVFK